MLGNLIWVDKLNKLHYFERNFVQIAISMVFLAGILIMCQYCSDNKIYEINEVEQELTNFDSSTQQPPKFFMKETDDEDQYYGDQSKTDDSKFKYEIG